MLIFFQLMAGIFTFLLGMIAWIAPHMDWSRVKDESLFSARGFVPLFMMAWIIGTLMWSGMARLPLIKRCPKCNGGGRLPQACGHVESCGDCGGCGRVEKK